MASNNNKRKAEEMAYPSDDGAGGNSDDGPPATKKKTNVDLTDDDHHHYHLPAVVWGHILDFMPYEDVRSALLISKTVANDAVGHIQTINIMKPSQLNVPAARRFPNVRELNILSLLKSAESSTNMFECELCADTISRTVFFAAAFPRVERILVGGFNFGPNVWAGIPYVCYNPQYCSVPHNHENVFDTLVKGFCGALKAGLLPHVTSIGGVIDHIGCCALVDGVRDPDFACDCQDICRFFPMENVMNPSRKHCLHDGVFFDIVGKRDSGLASFRESAFEMITLAIEKLLSVYEKNDLVRDGGEHAMPFIQTTADAYSELYISEDRDYARDNFRDDAMICYISDNDFAKIDSVLAKSGFNPKECSGEEERIFGYIWQSRGGVRVLAKSTYDGLISRGFPVDHELVRGVLVVVDDSKEPAMRGLVDRIREG